MSAVPLKIHCHICLPTEADALPIQMNEIPGIVVPPPTAIMDKETLYQCTADPTHITWWPSFYTGQ